MKKNHLMIIVCILAVCLISGCSKPFNKTFFFGIPYGNGYCAYAVQQTNDGGYILAGDINDGYFGFFLIKTDENGNKVWDKIFEGVSPQGSQYPIAMQQTSDGGYILAGLTYVTGWDSWMIKTDADGNIVWEKPFGGEGEEIIAALQQTSDGGYILAGATSSYGSYQDAWLIKTDADGNTVWDKTYGGGTWDVANAVQQTNDGGYILAGYTGSYGAGNGDIWLIKTDSSGETCFYNIDGNCYENESKWVKTFGESSDLELANTVQQTNDGGYILAGYTRSFGPGIIYAWLIKTNANGEIVWDKFFGGSLWENATDVQQTSDGGYILPVITYKAGTLDAWLIKTDDNGNIVWDKLFGGGGNDGFWAVQQTSDGGYILAGSTGSFGNGGDAAWLIKTDAKGNAPATPTP